MNDVEPTIQFTLEREKEGRIPFLDVVISRTEEGLKFSVYRKSTNKDDFVHYFSSRSWRSKRGIVIRFFLRNYRICYSEFLQDELKYITKTLIKLGFPEALIVILQEKALKIKARSIRQLQPDVSSEENRRNEKRTTLVAPSSPQDEEIIRPVAPDVKIVTPSGNNIRQVFRKRKIKKENRDSIVGI